MIGSPLISAPWEDSEGLFTAGSDYLVARSGAEMRACMRAVLSDAALAQWLTQHGRETILARHTCGHRVDELLDIAGVPAQERRPRVTEEEGVLEPDRRGRLSSTGIQP